MRKPNWSWKYEGSIASKLDLGRGFVSAAVAQLQSLDWPDGEVFGIRLALEEAVVNAMKHGNGLDESKLTSIQCKIAANRIWIQIEDEGTGFNPECVPDCTADENLDKTSGRGLLLMRHYMNFVEFNKAGNRVVMERVLGSSLETESE